MKHSRYAKNICVILPEGERENELSKICSEHGYAVFRGDENDLLKRHLDAAESEVVKKLLGGAAPHWVSKIPSDCPLIDSRVMDAVFDSFSQVSIDQDYGSNLHPATYPDGNDVEIFSLHALQKAEKEARRELDREHTTPYFWENPEKFRVWNYRWPSGLDYSMTHRFTLDYLEDLNFIEKVFEKLYFQNSNFSLEEIVSLLEKEKDLLSINSNRVGVNWYRHHLDELKTITPDQTRTDDRGRLS
jgi:spore coat polysaccharide biosynthesis protein SpsF